MRKENYNIRDMKKIKNIIISLIILLIVLAVVIVILIRQTSNIDENNTVVNNGEQSNQNELAKNSIEETNIYTILAIDNIIQNMFDYMRDNNKQALYNITDSNYVQKNNITTDNATSIYINVQKYYIQEVYVFQTNTRAEYYTYGFILKKGDSKAENYYLKINRDLKNSTFSIEPLKEEEYKKAKNGEINQIENVEIKENSYNKYNYNLYSSKDVVKRYIKDYIFKMKYMPEVAFNLLDEEYRNKKFSNLDEFKNYVQKNSDRFDNFVLKSYGKEIEGNMTQYVATDTNDYYYQIKASTGMKYSVILDNYTIETEEYVQKYNSASDSTKIATCINKFFKLIDSKEYKNAYSYLDDTFKQTNFNTVDKFETYAKQKFFNHNIVSIESAEKVGDVYSCKVQIKSGVSLSAMSEDITVIIMLKENTDFVMSFSMN